MTRIRMATIVLAAVAFVTAPVLAQNAPRVIVTGTVADTSGGVLPDVTITATAGGQSTGTATTGPDGRYRIELAGGTVHQLRLQHAGFAEQVVELQTGTANVTRDVVMGIAAISDTVVVTASSTPESRASTTASISAFTAADIDALGSSSVADIIRQVPGVNLEATEREGGLTSLFSRGGESDYNLVMIDGVRVNQSGGQFDFGRIAGAEIDRLEVVRGAQSSLYGSYAIGSVVQVFTKRGSPGDPPEFFGSIEAGSFNTVRTDVGVVGGARRMVDYQLGVTYRRTDGAFSDILPEKDTFEQPTFNGGVGVTMGDRATLRTGVRVSNAKGHAAGPIVYGARDSGTAYDTYDRSGHVDFNQRLTSQVNHSATFSYYRSRSFQADTIGDATSNLYAVLAGTPGAIFPNGPRLVRLVDQATFNTLRAGGVGAGEFLGTTSISDFPFTFRTQFERPAFRYQANATWGGDQILTGGYEFEREKNPLIPVQKIDNHSYFVQQQFKVRGQWFFTVGGRLDDNSRFGNSFSPKLSAGGFPVPFRPGPLSSLKVFTNVGRGIKNPVFGELFGSSFVDGNPDLHPERARTVDLGTEMTFNDQRWLTRFAYFDNRFNDQVAYRPTGFSLDGRPDFLNIDGSKAHGLELEAALQRPWMGLTMSGWYARVDTKVVAFVSTSEQFQPGQPLLRRPKHVSSFRLMYVRGRGSINFDWRYTGRRHDSSFLFPPLSSPQFPGRSIDIMLNPGYTMMGLGGEVRLHDAATVYVRINNLADEKYEMALGYPALPRTVVVGARFSVGR